MAQYNILTSTGLIVVASLREYFSTHKLTQNYRWSLDSDKRDIEILEQWPEDARKFPLIVVDTVYTGEDVRYMSDQAHQLTSGNERVGDYKSGVDNLECRIQVNEWSKVSCDEIMDLVIWGLKRDVERAIWDASLFNIQPQRNVRAAGAGARPHTDGQLLYFSTISVPVKSTWYDEVVYDESILTYLATAEREKMSSGTDTVQFQAD
jgi:hypothetical protein